MIAYHSAVLQLALMPMPPALIAGVAIAVLVTAWLPGDSHTAQRPANTSGVKRPGRDRASGPEFPSAGLLVPEGVLQSAGSSSAAIWDALEAAAVPVAVEYFR